MLDVVDRLNGEDHPNLLEPVKRTERDADPPKCRLDRWSCASAATPDVPDKLARPKRREGLLLDDTLDRREELLRTHPDTAAEC